MSEYHFQKQNQQQPSSTSHLFRRARDTGDDADHHSSVTHLFLPFSLMHEAISSSSVAKSMMTLTSRIFIHGCLISFFERTCEYWFLLVWALLFSLFTKASFPVSDLSSSHLFFFFLDCCWVRMKVPHYYLGSSFCIRL